MIWRVFKEKLTEKNGKCTQFVSHLRIFINPDLLEIWRIRFTKVHQEQCQIVVVFPLSYYWGYGAGDSILESRSWAEPSWDLQSYRFCNLNNQLCHDAHTPDKPVLHISQEHLDGQ